MARESVPGNLIVGPAIIEEQSTNIVIFPGQEALLDQYMNYVVEIAAAHRKNPSLPLEQRRQRVDAFREACVEFQS